MTMEDILKGMVERTFIYRARHHKVLSYKIEPDHNRVTVVTDQGWYDLNYRNAKKTLRQEFLPAAEERAVVLSSASNGTFKEVSQAILDNIKLIQKGEADIGRVDALNSSINTLVNVAKLELQILKQKMKD